MNPSATAPELRARLMALSPRSRQILMQRAVDGRSREECAARYAIPPETFDVHLLRALQEFIGRSPSPEPIQVERTQGRELSEAIESGSAPTGELAGLAEAFATLSTQSPAIVQEFERAERAAEASGKRKRQDLLRWAFIALILALTAYFYFRPKHEPRLEPRSALPARPAAQPFA
jgi:hypothetical protein